MDLGNYQLKKGRGQGYYILSGPTGYLLHIQSTDIPTWDDGEYPKTIRMFRRVKILY